MPFSEEKQRASCGEVGPNPSPADFFAANATFGGAAGGDEGDGRGARRGEGASAEERAGGREGRW